MLAAAARSSGATTPSRKIAVQEHPSTKTPFATVKTGWPTEQLA
jgi:hypothetical protein